VGTKPGIRRLLTLAALAAPLGLTACAPSASPWNRPTRADREAIVERYILWQAALADKRPADAYPLMSPDYRAGHSLADFVGSISQHWPALEPGYSLGTKGDKGYLYPYDEGWFELWNGPELEWVKVDGEWYLTGEVTWYTD
jgi:hypothetical protein